MKIKQTNAEGEEEEIEVSTQAEVAVMEAKHKEELDAKEGSLSSLVSEKKELEDKISKMATENMKEDHPNFKVLKDALGKKDEEIKGIKTILDDDKKQRVADEMDSQIKIASRGNTELEKKINFHLEKTVMGLPEGTKAERQTKLEAAFKLAADNSGDGPGIFDGGTSGGGRGGGGVSSESTNEFSSKEKALGAKLGLSDADYKKYGARVSKRN